MHLEFGPIPLPETDADIIVAAGDIGVGVQGVRWLREAGKPVIYVAGNHEYYGGDLLSTYARMAHAAQGSCIHFLENDSIVLGGVRFLGTTLWTDFDGSDPDMMSAAAERMNDFEQISVHGRELRPADLVEANWQARHWLKSELARPFDGRTVVVTHHAPLPRSWNNGRYSAYRAAYCNDLSALMSEFDIALWFHGHIHTCADYQTQGVRVLCNPRGYNGHQTVANYDPGKTVTL